jgi:hypothetical protein
MQSELQNTLRSLDGQQDEMEKSLEASPLMFQLSLLPTSAARVSWVSQEIEQYVLKLMPADSYASQADRDRENVFLLAERVEDDLRRATDKLKDTVKHMNDAQIEGGDRSDAVR